MHHDNVLIKMLETYLNEVEKREFDWANANCTHFVQGWIERLSDIQIPMPHIKGKRSALKQIADAGGLAALWDRSLLSSGIAQTQYPQYGDIAVAETRDDGDVGGIVAYGAIYVRCEAGGLVAYQPNFAERQFTAWSLPKCAG